MAFVVLEGPLCKALIPHPFVGLIAYWVNFMLPKNNQMWYSRWHGELGGTKEGIRLGYHVIITFKHNLKRWIDFLLHLAVVYKVRS